MPDQSFCRSSRTTSFRGQFDLLRITGHGNPIWVSAAESLSSAMRRASALCEGRPEARYMIFRQDTQEKIFVSGNAPIKSETGGGTLCQNEQI